MNLIPTSDGGVIKPELMTLEKTRDWDTKTQQQILDVLLDTEPINEDAQFDIELVEDELEKELGDERPSTGYIFHVRGKYVKVVPTNSERSWNAPYVLVQVCEDKGHAPQRQYILDAMTELADVDSDGVIDIDRLGEEVMRKFDLDRQPTSNIWQAIGRFAAVVPEDMCDVYQDDSVVASDSVDTQEELQDGIRQGVQSGSVAALSPDDEDVDSSSYHMGYADGYRAALQEQGD